MKPCYVYVIRSGKSANSPIKIGMANDPDARIKQLQTGNPVAIKLIMRIKCDDRKHALYLEKTLHDLLSGQNMIGEWFKVMRSNLYKTINAIGEKNDIPTLDVVEGLFDDEINGELITPERKRKIDQGIKSRDKTIGQLSAKIKKQKLESQMMRSKLFEFGLSHQEVNKIIGRGK